jgi:Man1-Src1p-C-terminal domain
LLIFIFALSTDVADVLEDGRECRPCPEHGTCVDGGLVCEMGYRVVDGRCVEDQEVSLYAEDLASRASGELRSRKGRNECGEEVQERLSGFELREFLEPKSSASDGDTGSTRRRRRQRFDPSKFPAAFVKAIGLLRSPGTGGETESAFGVSYDSGTYGALTADFPLRCLARRFVFRNWRIFGGVCVALVTYIYVAARRSRRNARVRDVTDTCNVARELLLEQWTKCREGVAPDPFIIDTQLRDEILGTSAWAIGLWKEAEAVLARDTRVDKVGPRTVRGHPCYVWEWRGRQSQLVGSNDNNGSRRLSFGSSVGGSGSHRRRSFGSVGGGSSGGHVVLRSPFSARE